jgi:hypothetical protein
MLVREARELPGAAAVMLHAIPILLAVEWRVRISGVSFELAEISLLVVAAVGLFAWATSSRVHLPRNFVIPAAILAASSFVTVFLQSNLQHNLSVYRDLMLPVLFYAGFVSLRLRPAHALALVKTFIVCASIGSVLAVLQFFTDDFLWFQSDDTAFWQEFKAPMAAESALGQALGASHTLPLGFYSHPNNFASYLVIPAMAAYALSRSRGRSGVARLSWGACALLQTFAVILTFSRASFLTLLASAMAFELLIMRRRMPSLRQVAACAGLTVGLLAAALTSELFSFDELGSFLGRIDMLRSSGELLLEHPGALLTGGLTEIYMNTFFLYNQLVHNLFAYMTLQFGLLAMLAWVFLAVSEAKKSTAGLFGHAGATARVGGAVLLGLLFSVFLYGQSYSLLDSVQIGLWLLFWLGVSRHLAGAQAGDVRSESKIPRQFHLALCEGGLPS